MQSGIVSGDVARLYAGPRFDNDNFFKGVPWEIALWRFTPAELKAGLQLKILPLPAGAPIFLERSARPDFANKAELIGVKKIALIREFEATLSPRRD